MPSFFLLFLYFCCRDWPSTGLASSSQNFEKASSRGANFLLQNLSTDDAIFSQRQRCQKWNKSQCSSQLVQSINGLSKDFTSPCNSTYDRKGWCYSVCSSKFIWKFQFSTFNDAAKIFLICYMYHGGPRPWAKGRGVVASFVGPDSFLALTAFLPSVFFFFFTQNKGSPSLVGFVSSVGA